MYYLNKLQKCNYWQKSRRCICSVFFAIDPSYHIDDDKNARMCLVSLLLSRQMTNRTIYFIAAVDSNLMDITLCFFLSRSVQPCVAVSVTVNVLLYFDLVFLSRTSFRKQSQSSQTYEKFMMFGHIFVTDVFCQMGSCKTDCQQAFFLGVHMCHSETSLPMFLWIFCILWHHVFHMSMSKL